MTALAGFRPLLHASLRHNTRSIAPWIVVATALSVSSVIAYPSVFPTDADRAGFAIAVESNPAMGLIFGPAFDLTTTDGFNAWRTVALGGFLTALGMILLVTKATRAQEDSGQAELLASGVMGRGSRLATATAMGLIGSTLAGLVAGLVTIAAGGGTTSSLLIGATYSATGYIFTGVAAITSQLGSDARTANSMAVGTLGVLYLARGFAYSMELPDWCVWINPLSWMTETKPALDNRWWPLLLALALTAVELAVGFWLQSRRDFGMGAIAPRPGAARGRIRSAWRLALKLNAGPMVIWTLAFAILGTNFGYFATEMPDLLADNPGVQQFLASGATSPDELLATFLVTVFSLLGIIAAVPGVQTMLKVRSEELADRVEPVLARPISRWRYLAPNAILALCAPALYLLLAGALVAWRVDSADLSLDFADVALQSAVTVPAVWTVVALAVAVTGALPRLGVIAWVGVLASFSITILGPLFDLPEAVLAISPFWHVPDVNLPDPQWSGLATISLITATFLAIGFVGFRRRDLAT